MGGVTRLEVVGAHRRQRLQKQVVTRLGGCSCETAADAELSRPRDKTVVGSGLGRFVCLSDGEEDGLIGVTREGLRGAGGEENIM